MNIFTVWFVNIFSQRTTRCSAAKWILKWLSLIEFKKTPVLSKLLSTYLYVQALCKICTYLYQLIYIKRGWCIHWNKTVSLFFWTYFWINNNKCIYFALYSFSHSRFYSNISYYHGYWTFLYGIVLYTCTSKCTLIYWFNYSVLKYDQPVD